MKRSAPAWYAFVVATCLTATPAAGAPATAPSSCQGRTATITSEGGDVAGTEGDDVISTTGVVNIRGLGGNDTICAAIGTVDAGAGDDSVRSTAIGLTSMTIHLGAGDDVFAAASGNNTVDPRPGDSLGRDVISTGDATDTVSSGVVGEPNLDQVDLGAGGSDSLSLVLPIGSAVQADGGAPVSPGYGSDTLHLADPGTPAADWSVDLHGSVRRSGQAVASFARFSGYGFDLGAAAQVAVIGTAASEVLTVSSAVYDVTLGAGDDVVRLQYDEHVSGRFVAGTGSDSLVAEFTERLLVDLETGAVRADASSLSATEVENFSGGGQTVRVQGSRQPNDIRVIGCDVRMNGGAGGDYLAYGALEDAPECHSVHTRFQGGSGPDKLSGTNRADLLVGGPGNDRLTGFAGKDVLLGGPGRDRADAGKGKDRCDAEVRVACESGRRTEA